MADAAAAAPDGGKPAVIPDETSGNNLALISAPTTPSNSNSTILPIESADIIRLLLHHLTESGLHSTAQTLRLESGIGNAGIPHAGLLRGWAREGQWGMVLECLEMLDAERSGLNSRREGMGLVADVHEMTVLELAEGGEVELAYAALRLCSEELDEIGTSTSSSSGDTDVNGMQERRTSSIERRIQSLTSLRSLDNSGTGGTPPDYYGPNNISRQKRREEIGKALAEAVPVVPAARLTSLLQQAVKWQVHTGQLPQVRELWEDDDDADKDTEEGDDGDDDDKDDKNDRKKKKKKRKRSKSKSRRRKKFDLVLGEVDIVTALEVGADGSGVASSKRGSGSHHPGAERIVKSPYSTVKFGKKSYVECATFLPDGSGLITGSSDGFIEIWDAEAKYEDLRMDLPYQRADEILLHDAAVLALAVSNDGTMLATGSTDGMLKVWKVADGKCLRQFDAAHRGAISCLSFSADATHVLSGSHDASLREFGLRAARMLKEFRGHGSYVNSCSYVTTVDGCGGSSSSRGSLVVVSASADGTVRVWDYRSSECQYVLNPSMDSITVGMSLASASAADETVSGRSVHTVLPMHTPVNALIVVPRSLRAYLVSTTGTVLRVFDRDDTKGRTSADEKADFVAATLSPSNKWLYVATEDGLLLCFDTATGRIEKTIRDFAVETSDSETAEISGLVHHVHKGLLGGYSNDKGLKRGRLTLWK